MPYFAVFREPGPAWDALRPMRGQAQWAEHAAFMNALADGDFIMLGGPLGDGSRTLLIVNAENQEAIRARLAGDPWTLMSLLSITGIEPWEILLGSPP